MSYYEALYIIPCEEGRWGTGNGNVLSQTMCLKRRTISNTCRWFRTVKKQQQPKTIFTGLATLRTVIPDQNCFGGPCPTRKPTDLFSIFESD